MRLRDVAGKRVHVQNAFFLGDLDHKTVEVVRQLLARFGRGERGGAQVDRQIAAGRAGAGDQSRAHGLRLQCGAEPKAVVRGAACAAGDQSGFRPGARIRIEGDPGWGGAVRGYWATDVEWIYCRPEPGHKDGRWRPAESGTQPLVDGLAPGMGRTRAKRLRGFGDAIVLPLATTFVSAVIDALVDAALEEQTAAPLEVVAVVSEQPAASPAWTGPREGETAPSGMLFGRVPGERWPYGPPSTHEPRCNLFPHRGSPGGLFCDCATSAIDDVEHGVSV